jgi:hypothetical protein
MTMHAAAKQMASWRLHGSCNLSPTLAGLGTHAALIRTGFDFEAGDADVGASAAWKCFFHQPQGDRLAENERESFLNEEQMCTCNTYACGNLLSLPIDCRVTSPHAKLGFGRTSFNVKLSFQWRGYEFAWNSQGAIDHTAGRELLSYTYGAITVLQQRGQGDLVPASWEYL